MIGLVLAFAATVFLVFAPCAYKQQSALTAPGPLPIVEHFRCVGVLAGSLYVWPLLLVPLLLALTSVAAANLSRPRLLWAPAVLLFAFAFLTGFSIGLFYFPAAIALIVSAALGEGKGPASQPSS